MLAMGSTCDACRSVQCSDLEYRAAMPTPPKQSIEMGFYTNSPPDGAGDVRVACGLTLAACQLAEDIPQVVRNLLTLRRWKRPCELLDRTAPKHLNLRHQPRELVLILRFLGINHLPYMAPDRAHSIQVMGNIFRQSVPGLAVQFIRDLIGSARRT
jgi:hypothetical protein